jgi:Fe-coproporphyrin III synthase
MSRIQSLYHTYKRYRTLQTDYIHALPIVILMPHSACNCRCVMCDIWKDNKNLKQLTPDDLSGLMGSLKKLDTQQVLMSGGEALLNPHFFELCKLLRQEGISVCLLSTGLTIEQHAHNLVQHVQAIIVSLDGDEDTHNRIRNIPHAFQKLKEGVQRIKTLSPRFSITARTVIHRLNFRNWPAIIDTAKQLGLDQISFLPADVSSHAFNRDILWSDQRQHEIVPSAAETHELKIILDKIIIDYKKDFERGFIAESPEKLKHIPAYYAAFYGQSSFPYKKCNAPWVSVVVEADGTVRPCFFHAPMGSVKEKSLQEIINSPESIRFRKELDIKNNNTCIKCVCYLNLSPRTKVN